MNTFAIYDHIYKKNIYLHIIEGLERDTTRDKKLFWKDI